MALRDLHEDTMLDVALSYTDPQQYRPLLEAEPLLAPFIPEFAAVAAALKKAGEDVDADLEVKKEGVKGTQSSLEAKHDRVIRQLVLTLEGHAYSEDKDRVQAAARLSELLVPDGRSLTRFSLSRKLGAAEAADAKMDAEKVRLAKKLRAPDGTALDLHERRMELAASLISVRARLNSLNQVPESGLQLNEARDRFIKTMRAFESVVAFADLGNPEVQNLLGVSERAQERADARRARVAARSAEEGGGNGAVEGPGDGGGAGNGVGGSGVLDPLGPNPPPGE